MYLRTGPVVAPPSAIIASKQQGRSNLSNARKTPCRYRKLMYRADTDRLVGLGRLDTVTHTASVINDCLSEHQSYTAWNNLFSLASARPYPACSSGCYCFDGVWPLGHGNSRYHDQAALKKGSDLFPDLVGEGADQTVADIYGLFRLVRQ